FQFEDGSGRVRITLHLDGHGTIQVGDSPLTPLPTDANVGYPPSPWNWRSVWGRVGEELKPGLVYDVYQTRVDTARIRFNADYRDVYRAWCAMQTPHSNTVDLYTCLSDLYSMIPSDDGTSCTVVDGLNQPTSGVDCVQVLV